MQKGMKRKLEGAAGVRVKDPGEQAEGEDLPLVHMPGDLRWARVHMLSIVR